MALGEVLKQRRQAKGLTQKELAARVGVPAPWLCRVEKGWGDYVDVFRLAKVTQELDCSVDEVLKESQEDEDEATQLVAA